MDWREVFRAEPAEPRPLTRAELQRLERLGFPELARRLRAGVCPSCGLSRDGRTHRELCVDPMTNPQAARQPPAQPWEPRAPRARPSRRAA